MSTLVEELAARSNRAAITGMREPHAVRRATQAVADTAVAMLAGAESAEARITRATALRFDSTGSAILVGTSETTSPTAAAISNGTAAHALEIDDFGGPGHPGAVVIPALLGLVEEVRPSGAEFIRAVLAGYEASTVAVDILGGYRAQTDRGWHVTGTCGPFGAAAAAARLLNLDEKQLVHALAIAGSSMGAVWAFQADGAMTKRIHAGRAAEVGLTAALLASEGCTGPLQLFEAEMGGLIRCFGDASIGVDWRSENSPGIMRAGFKSYAACRGVHWAIDGLLELTSNAVDASDVEQIDLLSPPHALRMFADAEPRSLVAAQLSLPFAAAATLTLGEQVNDAYRGEGWKRTTIHEAIPSVVLKPARDPSFPEVVLHLRDGRTVATEVPRATGEPGEPVTDGQLRKKIWEWTQDRFSAEQAEELFSVCGALSELPNLDPLIVLLTMPRDRTHA